MSKLTKKDIVDQIDQILNPGQASKSKIVNLMDYINNMPSTPMSMAPRPVGNVSQPAEPTPENMAATIAAPELPKPKSYPFERKR